MSVTTRSGSGDSILHNDYNTGKIFVWDNRYKTATFKNNTGATASFARGTVLGRDSSDNTLVPLDSANALNGEAVPVGILDATITDLADAGTQANVSYCHQGDVVESRLTFQAGDKNTVIASGGNRSIEDLLKSIGIVLVGSLDLTRPDNA